MKAIQFLLLLLLIIFLFSSTQLQAQVEEEEIYRIVEKMPTLSNCNSISDEQERKNCTQRELIKYIHQNIVYPDSARANTIRGTVVIEFIISKAGKITNIKLIKDIGYGCGNELIRVINKMNTTDGIKWIPGKQAGEIVLVKYSLPVQFRFE